MLEKPWKRMNSSHRVVHTHVSYGSNQAQAWLLYTPQAPVAGLQGYRQKKMATYAPITAGSCRRSTQEFSAVRLLQRAAGKTFPKYTVQVKVSTFETA